MKSITNTSVDPYVPRSRLSPAPVFLLLFFNRLAVLVEQLACAFRWLAGDVRHCCARGQIDHNGSALFCYEAKRPDVAWDYRGYDIQLDNLILKGEIEEIAEGYNAFEAYL